MLKINKKADWMQQDFFYKAQVLPPLDAKKPFTTKQANPLKPVQISCHLSDVTMDLNSLS